MGPEELGVRMPRLRYRTFDLDASPLAPRLGPAASKEASHHGSGSRRSFLGSLFSAREPSAQALAEYEAYLRAQGSLKPGRVAMTGLPGVSPRTLPRQSSPCKSTKSKPRSHGENKTIRQNRLAEIYGWDEPEMEDQTTVPPPQPSHTRLSKFWTKRPIKEQSHAPDHTDLQTPSALSSADSFTSSLHPPSLSESVTTIAGDSLPATPDGTWQLPSKGLNAKKGYRDHSPLSPDPGLV